MHRLLLVRGPRYRPSAVRGLSGGGFQGPGSRGTGRSGGGRGDGGSHRPPKGGDVG